MIFNKQTLNRLIQNASVLLLLIAPNIYYVFFKDYGFTDGVECIFTSILYTLPLFFLLIYCKWTKFGITIISILFAISLIEISMIILFKNFILAGNILSVINTNNEEAAGFLKNSFKVMIYWIPVCILFVIVVYCYIHRKSVLKKNLKFIVILGSFFVAFSFVFFRINKTRLTYSYFVPTRILNRNPFNFFYQIYNVCDYYKVRGYIKDAENCTFEAIKRDTLQEKEIYILAIGESLRYNNLSLNGLYPRETTPNLESEKQLVLFEDYYSTATLTMFSVPHIITRATPQNHELNYKEKSIFFPFKETGFKTYCISNKYNFLTYEKHLTNGIDSLIVVDNDKDIVDWVSELSGKNDKIFFILQFFGSHSVYDNYTPEFERYNPNINNYQKEDKDGDSLYINAYDNTILYTDYILSEIINAVKIQNAVATMTFVSDHGENVKKTGGGHGGDCKPPKTEYHVPLIIWYSDLYAKYYPSKIDAIIDNKTKKLNATNIFYTVIDLANIDIAEEKNDKTMSISNQEFKELEKRFLLLPDGKNIIEVK